MRWLNWQTCLQRSVTRTDGRHPLISQGFCPSVNPCEFRGGLIPQGSAPSTDPCEIRETLTSQWLVTGRRPVTTPGTRDDMPVGRHELAHMPHVEGMDVLDCVNGI